MRLAAWICALLLLWPATARAEWLEASSPHFVVYADDTEEDIRRFADRLERYQAAMAFITSRSAPDPSPSNRVTVFVVKSEREVRKLAGGSNPFLAGFYIPRAGGSLAIVPRLQGPARGETVEPSLIMLLHEYAHHFLISNSRFPSPRWLGEGAAEFFSAAKFAEDGGVTVGMPAHHRAAELFRAVDVRVGQLLDPATYKPGASYDAFYGKSWVSMARAGCSTIISRSSRSARASYSATSAR